VDFYRIRLNKSTGSETRGAAPAANAMSPSSLASRGRARRRDRQAARRARESPRPTLPRGAVVDLRPDVSSR
jgi:hypothetical protein